MEKYYWLRIKRKKKETEDRLINYNKNIKNKQT